MREEESLVGAIARAPVLCFMIYLFASGAVYFIHQYRNGSSTSSEDDMSLAALARLSFNDIRTNSQLLDAGFWSTVLDESGRTAVNIGPGTVFGFIQSSRDWASFVSQNLDNPPRGSRSVS